MPWSGGDDELNEVKLINYLDVIELTPVVDEDFPQYYNSYAGYVGPIGLKKCQDYC